jgi:hypothetical protein
MKRQIVKVVLLAFVSAFLHFNGSDKKIAILAIYPLKSHFYISL